MRGRGFTAALSEDSAFFIKSDVFFTSSLPGSRQALCVSEVASG